MPDTTTTVPPTDGLDPGRSPDPDSRTGDDLIEAAAADQALSVGEQQDLLAYYLTNDTLPGDGKPSRVEWEIGHGDGKRTQVWEVRPIAWEEWQDARRRATDEQTGVLDVFAAASLTVARALVKPVLGPVVRRLVEDKGAEAPPDAAALLRRMFRHQSGVLIDIHSEILTISKLSNDGHARILDSEVEAGKT